MRFSDAIDLYIADQRRDGRINSPRSERTYRDILNLHADDVGNRDPRTVGREDVKRTLSRWDNPNTIRGRRAALVSFFDWCMEEGVRKDNPARQTRRPKKRPSNVYRLNAAEVAAMWHGTRNEIERRAVRIGLGAGLRSNELRHLQGRHLSRDGFIWVSADIAKGGRVRYVPVIADLRPLIAELRDTVGLDEYVICGQVNASPGRNNVFRLDPTRPMGATTLWRLVGNVAKRAGINADIYPHLLRHAYADHVARHAGLRVAQAMLGHADIGTTVGYTGAVTLDDLRAASGALTLIGGTSELPPQDTPDFPLMETVGIEPTLQPFQPVEPVSAGGNLSRVLADAREFFLPIVRAEAGA